MSVRKRKWTTSSGERLLYVVNHGANESIEIFSVSKRRSTPSLHWRGCVYVGNDLHLNDVAALPGGGFVATANEYKDDFGVAAGHVLRWTQRTGLHGFVTLPGKSVNGIETSIDGRYAFVNEDRDDATVKISLETSRVMAAARIRTPDNSSWSQDGRLLVASLHLASFQDAMLCDKDPGNYCDIPFDIIAVDPRTMRASVLFSHAGGDPFGAATVAVQVGKFLYMGSFAGDRVARATMQE